MKLHEMDEYQGLTEDMVQEWLANLDPAIKPSACIADDILAIGELCGENPQAILRDINPRMRSISNGAINSHAHNGGWWIVCDAYQEPSVRRLIIKLCDGKTPAKGWPCDEHGNKVRWPTDAEGNML